MDIDVYSDKGEISNNADALVGGLEDPEIIVNMGTTAAKIAYYNFEWRYVTLVMFNTMLRIGVDPFLRVYNQSVYLKLGKFVPKHRKHVPQFVLFGQDTAELSEVVQWLIQNRYDNTANYITICSSSNDDKCSETDMFRVFSRFYMPNVIFLKAPIEGNEPLMFTYYPVLPGQCRNTKPILMKLVNCSADVCYKDLYPEKYGNLHKCAFVVSSFEQPPFMHMTPGANGTLVPSGADGDMIKLVAELLNATLVITIAEANDSGHYKENNWTGSLGDVFNKRAHVSLCSAPLTPQIYGNFQISFTYASMDIVWAARLPPLKPSYEKLLYPLKFRTRISLLVIFVAIIFINALMKTKLWEDVRRVLNIGPTNVSLLFYSWSVYMGNPLVRIPVKPTLRTIIVSWIWFSYIIRTAYQAAVVSSMKVQLYEEHLQSFNEVLEKQLSFGGLESLRDSYLEDREVFSKWVIINFGDSYHIIDQILDGGTDFVIAVNKEFMIYNVMRYNGTKRLQMLPEKIVNSPAVLYFKKFAPLRSPVSEILCKMVEGGIIDMFYSHYLEHSDYLFHHEAVTGAEPLQFHHVWSSFIILFIGWALSVIYFVVEVFGKKFGSRNNNSTIA